MFLDFPTNPTLGQMFPPVNQPSLFGIRFQWLGNRWILIKDITQMFYDTIASLAYKHVLVVHKNGNNATAKPDSLVHPYQTILAAVADATKEDLIIVYPGFYSEATIGTKSVNIYCHVGVILAGNILHFSTSDIEFNLFGYAEIQTTRGIYFPSSASNQIVIIHCLRIKASLDGVSLRNTNCTNVRLEVYVLEDIHAQNRYLVDFTGTNVTNCHTIIKCRDFIAQGLTAEAMYQMRINRTTGSTGNVAEITFRNMLPPKRSGTIPWLIEDNNANTYIVNCENCYDDREDNMSYESRYYLYHRNSILKWKGNITKKSGSIIGAAWAGSFGTAYLNGHFKTENTWAIVNNRGGAKLYIDGTVETENADSCIYTNWGSAILELNGKIINKRTDPDYTGNLDGLRNNQVTANIKIHELEIECEGRAIVSNVYTEIPVTRKLYYDNEIHSNIYLKERHLRFPDYHKGIKTLIDSNQEITIPEHHDYNTYTLDVDGIVNLEGQINLFLSEFDGGGA